MLILAFVQCTQPALTGFPFSVDLIYPILNPVSGKQIAEIIHIASANNVIASQNHCGNHYISISLSHVHAAT
jgi:hypothetical protein